MRIGKYWIRGEFSDPNNNQLRFSCWGVSDICEEDALRDARERADKILRKIRGEPQNIDTYKADIIEEVVEKISARTIVTRNRYGARVLNTQELTIIDVDTFPPGIPQDPIVRFFKKLFGKKDPAPIPLKQVTLAHIESVLEKEHFDARIYETAAGFRIILNTRELSPSSREFRMISSRLRADRRYTELCVRQHCFRARLSPKPYRMKITTCRYAWPQTEEIYRENRGWVENYELRSRDFSVCKLVKTYGNDFSVHPLIRFHDAQTVSGKKLA
ncbi:MAG: hypothetical protein J6L64_06475 [Opitutales bacterium]|nr:hypothetical protein [Opitutales bacterium]